MHYQITRCREADLKNILTLCTRHAVYEGTSYDSRNKMAKLKKALFGIKPKLFCWVVEADNGIVGYATYHFGFSTWDARDFLYLDCLYLEPEYRGFGIGEEIMKRLRMVARVNRCINLQWQTPDFNERAIKFYKRIGGIPKNKIRFSIATS